MTFPPDLLPILAAAVGAGLDATVARRRYDLVPHIQQHGFVELPHPPVVIDHRHFTKDELIAITWGALVDDPPSAVERADALGAALPDLLPGAWPIVLPMPPGPLGGTPAPRTPPSETRR